VLNQPFAASGNGFQMDVLSAQSTGHIAPREGAGGDANVIHFNLFTSSPRGLQKAAI
jgi:hypothetical protein